jgi:hypothetical protein
VLVLEKCRFLCNRAPLSSAFEPTRERDKEIKRKREIEREIKREREKEKER